MMRGVVSTALRGRTLLLGKRNKALLAYGSISEYEPYLQDYISSLKEKFIFCDVTVIILGCSARSRKRG